MHPLDVVRLRPLMRQSNGSPDVAIGLIDGPVAANHPDLTTTSVRDLGPPRDEGNASTDRVALSHGTYVAGILTARRGSAAPAICPGCTLLVRPIFLEAPSGQLRCRALRPTSLPTPWSNVSKRRASSEPERCGRTTLA